MAQSDGVLKWDIKQISSSLCLSEEDTREYFTDGRRVSFVLERRLAFEVMRGHLAPSEGAGYDLLDSNQKKWEVRSISKGGIYFCPSYMVGSGRVFEEKGFLAKLSEIEGYIVSDIEQFPIIPYWKVSKHIVEKWYNANQLGSGTKISRKKILKLLNSI